MSEVATIKEPSEEWVSVPLEDCAEILDSKRIPLNSKQRSERIEGKSQDQLYPYYGATGQVGLIDDFIFEGEHLLIGEDGAPFFDKSKNVAYIAKGKFWVNNHAHILSAKNSITSNKYLLHFLNNFNYKGFVNGTTRLKLNQGNLKKIPVPIAPPEQQKRIVAKIEELFSHIDAGIEALKKAKQLLKQYRQSVLKAAVTGELTKEWREQNGISFEKTWRSIELGDVTEVIDPNPSHRYPPYDDGDVPLMSTKQMVDENDWDKSTAKLTTTKFYEKRKSIHGFNVNDVVFARKGRLGLARRPPNLKRYAFSHTLFIVRGKKELDSNYLLLFLRREEAVSWLLKEMNVGAGVPTLGKAIFKKLPLQLPEIKEQLAIADVNGHLN